MKLQAFASSFANLYTDHSSVTVRICKNGNFTSEFVEDQVNKQGLNYLIQKDPINKTSIQNNQEERLTETLTDEILLKGTNFILYESELYRLSPPHFLSDEIINAYMKLVSEKNTNVYIFDTFFHQTLEENGFNASRYYVKMNPFTASNWIIPINFQNCHWILLYANIENILLGKVTFDLYDSAVNLKYVYEIEVEEIRKYIIFMYEKFSNSKMSKLNVVLRNVSSSLPQQQNGYDCGPFLLGYAICLSSNIQIQFTQLNIDKFRPNMKHEFRRKKLDSNCCLFSIISENSQTTFSDKLPGKGYKKRPNVESFKQEKKQKKQGDEENESFSFVNEGDGTSAGLHSTESGEDFEPTKFVNYGTQCWLNSLIQLLCLIYTKDNGSSFLRMILNFKMSSAVEDASCFRKKFTAYDKTLR